MAEQDDVSGEETECEEAVRGNGENHVEDDAGMYLRSSRSCSHYSRNYLLDRSHITMPSVMVVANRFFTPLGLAPASVLQEKLQNAKKKLSNPNLRTNIYNEKKYRLHNVDRLNRSHGDKRIILVREIRHRRHRILIPLSCRP